MGGRAMGEEAGAVMITALAIWWAAGLLVITFGTLWRLDVLAGRWPGGGFQ